ncbi:SCO family protein [Natronorubrum bangense]|uniref:Electron transport protein SCO1/SenC n=2 Tax=Natronorubrum bangense TaxID=61858 RepID=L9W7J9_9EURY|nr:SCO family protein [Natronorubrum bangense]ELY45312.1 electron transport protein SCO1/SenC [Natronorubrum bangense JCM 10635]QCC56838.1 SCO family protein [Natronorubrum bangense]
MNRRSYIGALGATGAAGLSGCLGDSFGSPLSSGDSDTVLDPPEQARGDPSYPIHGEAFPSFSIPDPIAETTVSLDDLVGERPFVMTYFFTTCPDGACPALLLRLRQVQEDAVEHGYSDDVGLLAFTFDPERDTPDVLREYATERSIDYEADNWHFLRPDTYDEAETLASDTFGLALRRVDEDDDHDHDHDDDHDHGEYTFGHNNLITLVNEDGIVERAYDGAVQSDRAVSPETVVEEMRTIIGVE